MTAFRRTFLPSIAELLAFESVARHGSVSRAAAELALTQSAVSRQVRHLEEHLGTALFHRVRQRVVLTDVGRVYATEVHSLLKQLSDCTQKTMAQSDAESMLNLAVLPTLASRWLIPHLGAFMSRHRQATIHFSSRTEPFAFAGTPFDAAIHFGAPHWPGAVCQFLMHEEVIPVCSADFQRRHQLHHLEDLARVVLLQQNTRPTQWAQWFAQADLSSALALRGPSYEHFAMIAQAAVCGHGAALLPRFLIEGELSAGTLVVISDRPLRSNEAYYLVYPEARARSALLESFCHWLVELCASPHSLPEFVSMGGHGATGLSALPSRGRRHPRSKNA